MIRFKAFSVVEPSADYTFQQDEEECRRCDRPVRFSVPCDVIEIVALSQGEFVVHPETWEEKELVRSHPGYGGLCPVCPACALVVGSPYILRGTLNAMGFVPAAPVVQLPPGLSPEEVASIQGHLPWIDWK